MNFNLTAPIKEFVAELNGRYRAYISDVMLEYLLVYLIKIEYQRQSKRLEGNSREIELSNLVYMATVGIFESVLEYECRAGGNGHHVAQALASKFLKYG